MTPSPVHFGTLSLILGLGCLQGLVVLVLLLGAKRNREANRLLAALLAAAVLRIVPYIIGYAGFYDAYPWLSFAPFDIGLAFGPLVYLYVSRLTSASLPARWWLHLAPALVQLLYYCVVFAQPLAFKNHWDDTVQSPWVATPERWAILCSCATYLLLSAQRYRSYRGWLSDNVSFRDDIRIEWIRNFLVAFMAIILVWLGFASVELVRPLSYIAEFPLYVVFTAFVYYLGLEGWRHAELPYPVPEHAPIALVAPTLQAAPALDAWQEQGMAWVEEIRRRELWRDPELSLVTLARALGTNTTYLSKALNAGIGQNFNECINRLRVESVQQVLRTDGETRDLLAIALETGFRSKASFNRAFKSYTGQTPSDFRGHSDRTASQIVKIADS